MASSIATRASIKGGPATTSATCIVGAKVNLASEYQQKPVSLAVRGIVKVPTGKEDVGTSTGKTDFLVDFIASKELRRVVELSGYGGYEFRGQPDGFDAPTGAFRWGGGASFPSRSPLRGVLELNGVVPSQDEATITSGSIVGIDNSVAPSISATEKLTRATAGVTWQHRSGFFLGGGISWNVPRESRDGYRTDSDPFGDFVDWQVRLGYHPGTRIYVRAAAAAAAAATTATAATGEPSAGRQGAMRPLHGSNRAELDGPRRRQRSRWRHADLPLDGAERRARHAGGTRVAVDGAAAGGNGPRDRDGRRWQGWNGV